MMSQDPWPRSCQELPSKQKIKEARVLAVGAGGIGCELLKTLVLSGFENIEVIDMDTIETSNLNRQFLFRKWHVGESKAVVAAQAVHKFKPSASIKPHQANIKEPQYGVDFFKGFDIVLNGLDNLEARRHVNRLCLASRTPLVESGTAGYLGQVSVHLRLIDGQGEPSFASECFECQPKAAPKSYPVCTIRNTPDKPIHCIVWAKDLLFQRLFGSPEVTTDLDEKTEEEKRNDNSAESSGRSTDDPSDFLRRPEESAKAFAARIFERVFNTDIQTLLAMEDLWKTRRKPQSIQELTGLEIKSSLAALEELSDTKFALGATATSILGLKDSHKPWDLVENVQVFLLSTVLFLTTREGDVGSAVFDKDDNLAVEFVTAASNLRSSCYHIPTRSPFDAKGMAGNIIHAIATTNATIAGMIVVEAIKILTGFPKQCKMSYLQQFLSGKRLITAMDLSEPSPNCIVCGRAQLQLTINTASTTLQDFIDKVLKKRLSMNEPSIMAGNFAYEEGADLEPDEVAANARLLPVSLEELPGGGLKHGAIVSVSDQAQDFNCQLIVNHKDEWDEEKEPEGFTLVGKVPDAQQAGAAAEGANGAAKDDNDEESDDDFELVEDDKATRNAAKRKREATENGGSPVKKQALQEEPARVVSLE